MKHLFVRCTDMMGTKENLVLPSKNMKGINDKFGCVALKYWAIMTDLVFPYTYKMGHMTLAVVPHKDMIGIITVLVVPHTNMIGINDKFVVRFLDMLGNYDRFGCSLQ